MTPEEVAKLRPGLYLIFWDELQGGGTCYAAVGRGAAGELWLAPTEWAAPSCNETARSVGWERVREVQPLTGPDAKDPLDALEAVRDRLSRIRALAVGEEPRAKDKIAALVDELEDEVRKRMRGAGDRSACSKCGSVTGLTVGWLANGLCPHCDRRRAEAGPCQVCGRSGPRRLSSVGFVCAECGREAPRQNATCTCRDYPNCGCLGAVPVELA